MVNGYSYLSVGGHTVPQFRPVTGIIPALQKSQSTCLYLYTVSTRMQERRGEGGEERGRGEGEGRGEGRGHTLIFKAFTNTFAGFPWRPSQTTQLS